MAAFARLPGWQDLIHSEQKLEASGPLQQALAIRGLHNMEHNMNNLSPAGRIRIGLSSSIPQATHRQVPENTLRTDRAAHSQIPAAPRRQHPRDGMPFVDAEFVIYRLEEAGQTLLALPNTGYTTKLRTSSLDIIRDALDAYSTRGDIGGRLRPALPDAARISRMDEALAWIPLIPADRHVLRRIVGARSLVSPVTERHLFAWRRLAALLGADHKAVQRWHAQGIDMLVAMLNAR